MNKNENVKSGIVIGTPKEIKVHEYRVGLTPSGVHELVKRGNTVLIQRNAGLGSGFSDLDYEKAGAKITSVNEVFEKSDLIVKVKEPLAVERKRLRENQVLFTYLHLAADPEQAKDLMQSKCTAIAYETIVNKKGLLPLLTPMSEVAGRVAVQAGATCLQKPLGSGVLLGGVPGVKPGNVVIIGGGVVGLNSATMAIGLGANVTILDRDVDKLREIDDRFNGRVKTLYSNEFNLVESLSTADIVIGAVLIKGESAPKIIKKEHLKLMKKGSVLVDVAIDQGGCFETSKPTTHENPTYIVDDIIHYCVANIPGSVPSTSTVALTNVTLSYVYELCSIVEEIKKNSSLDYFSNNNFYGGLNVHKGIICSDEVTRSLKGKI